MSLSYTYRPLPVWPHPVTRPRQYPRFKLGSGGPTPDQAIALLVAYGLVVRVEP